MSVRRYIYSLVAGTMLLVSAQAFGAGFALYEGSAKGNAIGSQIASASDPATLFFNPAGMTHLEGIQFMAGVTLIVPSVDLLVGDGVYGGSFSQQELDTQVFTPPHLYYTHQLQDKLWIGMGVFSRFGLGTRYEKDWPGRYSNIDTQIQSISFNPNVAYKVNEKLSVAFGLTAMWFDATIESAIDANNFRLENPNNPATHEYDAVQKLEGDTWGFGFNFGLHYQLNDSWSAGLSYNSEVEQELKDGTAHFTRPQAQVPGSWFMDSNVNLDPIDLPEMIMLGFAGKLNDKVSMELGLIRTGWSSIKRLTFNYENPIVIIPGLGISLDQAGRDLNWEDTMRYNLGFDWQLSELTSVQFGVTIDETPIPEETVSYLLPTNDRRLLNVGVSRHLGEWVVDASFNYLTMKDRDIIYDDPSFQAQRQLVDGVMPTRVSNAGALLFGFSASRKF